MADGTQPSRKAAKAAPALAVRTSPLGGRCALALFVGSGSNRTTPFWAGTPRRLFASPTRSFAAQGLVPDDGAVVGATMIVVLTAAFRRIALPSDGALAYGGVSADPSPLRAPQLRILLAALAAIPTRSLPPIIYGANGGREFGVFLLAVTRASRLHRDRVRRHRPRRLLIAVEPSGRLAESFCNLRRDHGAIWADVRPCKSNAGHESRAPRVSGALSRSTPSLNSALGEQPVRLPLPTKLANSQLRALLGERRRLARSCAASPVVCPRPQGGRGPHSSCEGLPSSFRWYRSGLPVLCSLILWPYAGLRGGRCGP